MKGLNYENQRKQKTRQSSKFRRLRLKLETIYRRREKVEKTRISLKELKWKVEKFKSKSKDSVKIKVIEKNKTKSTNTQNYDGTRKFSPYSKEVPIMTVRRLQVTV